MNIKDMELYQRQIFLHQLFAEDPEGEGQDGADSKGNDPDPAGDPSPDKTFSQAEVDKLVSERLARESAKLKKEAEAAAAAAIEKAKKEADKKAKMDAEEKAKYEMEQLKKEKEELERYKATVELSRTATNLLTEQGLQATQDVLELLVAEDEEKTSENVEAFIKAVNAAVEAKAKERAKGTTPKRGGSGSHQEPKEGVAKEVEMRLQKYKKGKAS